MKNTSQTLNFQVDSEDEFQNLFDAIKKGNEDAFKKFLTSKNVNINSLNKDGNTPLHIAIKENRKNIIALLLEKVADLNIKNAKDKTPLNLIEKRCDKNPDSPWGKIKSILKRAKRSLDDTPTDSGINKKRDAAAQGIGYSKKPRTDPSLDKNTAYEASGVKRALHGTVYQSKLLMLFVKRGIEKEYGFRLATEMDAAEKFDDVVFRYQDQGKWTYRFLQAKHKLDTEHNRIGLFIHSLRPCWIKEADCPEKYQIMLSISILRRSANTRASQKKHRGL